ncbi:hypothetical protein F4782DRAFT_522110 [Xylaria castorea]|nr:hypothetical protein F4782DRAFT_522110 [Xylaria castorea]
MTELYVEEGPSLASFCHGTELDEQQFPARSAWREAQGEIDRFLEGAVTTPGVTALSLTSDPATGKSTTLMRHIAELAMASKAPSRVLYVVATMIEANFISSWLMVHGVLDTRVGVGGLRGVQVVTTEAMVKMFTEEGARWPAHLTIVFDINWYPEVDDEMALALLLHRTGEVKKYDGGMGVHMAIVLLMSGFESARTIKAFQKRLGSISQVKLDQEHEYPDLTHLEGDWKTNVRDSIGKWDGKGRVVLGAPMTDVSSWRGLRRGHPYMMPEVTEPGMSRELTLRNDLETAVKGKALNVRRDAPFALALTNISLVICTGEFGYVARFDTDLMQTVIYKRRMMFCEILRDLSWGIRSDQYGGVDPIVFAAPAKDYEELFAGAEPDRDDLGGAWNRDLWFLVLNLFKVWPGIGVGQFPTRPPIDIAAVTGTTRALLVLGCLTRQGKGWKCTELGLQILKASREMGPTLRFNVAFLLSRVVLMRRHSHASPVVVHVLIHMAAIAHVGSSAFLELKQPIDMAALVRCFPRVIPEQKWYAGFLWVGLGLYLFGCRHSKFSDAEPEPGSESDAFPRIDGVDVNTETGIMIEELVETFAGQVGVTLDKLQDTDWDKTSLTEAEIATVDRELMWAWLHRTAMFWPTSISEKYDVVSDMVSFVKFRVSMCREVIDASRVREESAKENKAGGAFYVIYEALMEVEDDQDSSAGRPQTRCQCHDITWIPGTAFADVEDKSNYIWPDAVGRSIIR